VIRTQETLNKNRKKLDNAIESVFIATSKEFLDNPESYYALIDALALMASVARDLDDKFYDLLPLKSKVLKRLNEIIK